MAAHLLAVIETATMKVVRVTLASQGPGSMSCSPQGCVYTELVKFDSGDYANSQNRLLEWLDMTYENNPFKAFIPLLLENEALNLGALSPPGSEIRLTVKAETPFEKQLMLLSSLYQKMTREKNLASLDQGLPLLQEGA